MEVREGMETHLAIYVQRRPALVEACRDHRGDDREAETHSLRPVVPQKQDSRRLANEAGAAAGAGVGVVGPPRSNLKEITLYGNIAAFAISFFSAGMLTVIAVIFIFWLTCAIQSGMEYVFATPQD